MTDDQQKSNHGKVRLRRTASDALQASKSLTVLHSKGAWTPYNLRSIATLFDSVANHLRQIANEIEAP